MKNQFFKTHALPLEAQFAPVNAIVAKDMDGDGNIDLLIAGNEYQIEISTGRYDASYGLFLTGNGKGLFMTVPAAKSGYIIEGDVKSMQVVSDDKHRQFFVAAINNDSMRYFTCNENNVPHIWQVNTGEHNMTVWVNDLYLFSQRIFKKKIIQSTFACSLFSFTVVRFICVMCRPALYESC